MNQTFHDTTDIFLFSEVSQNNLGMYALWERYSDQTKPKLKEEEKWVKMCKPWLKGVEPVEA